MKKFFSKIENTFDANSQYVGKVFNVGRYNVTVEETIAEGEYHSCYKNCQRV